MGKATFCRKSLAPSSPRTPLLDREELMSGNATGINFGDEQDWRGKVFENRLEKRQV